MTRTVILFFLLFLFMILAQVVVFNHIWLFSSAIPLVFIYIIICLPEKLPVGWVLTIGFLSGFLVDVFSNTPGLNALCCTIISGLKYPILKLYLGRDDENSSIIPSPYSLGIVVYLKYLVTFVTLYCIFYFIILSFDFFNLSRMIVRILASSLLSSLIILAFSYLFAMGDNRKK